MNRVEVLDHGYVELCDKWGSDEDIIRAARQSTQKGFLGWGPKIDYECRKCGQKNIPFEDTYESEETAERGHYGPKSEGKEVDRCWGHVDAQNSKPGDEGLLRYLWGNDHSTPFEFAGITIEVMAPIFVFREWHRHRVPFGYSEASARYAPLPDVNYVPSVERLLANSKSNKQAGTMKGADELTEASAISAQLWMRNTYADAEAMYQNMLKAGVPKELARIVLPVGRYSCMRATGNLRGWLAFLKLREAPNAQYEIRVYATVVHGLLRSCFPRTLALFEEAR